MTLSANALYILGFIRPSVLKDRLTITNTSDIDVEVGTSEKDGVLRQLDVLLQHVQIGGQQMTAEQFVSIDSDAPSFDEWNDNSEDSSVINIIPQEYDEDPDLPSQNPPTLTEALDMIRRLHVLSSTDYPHLYPVVSELESKLIDIYLERKTSKQSTIYNFFHKK